VSEWKLYFWKSTFAPIRQLAEVSIFNDFPLGIKGEKSLKIKYS
jgi:hypothetical protein